jgi:hypothetical protein
MVEIGSEAQAGRLAALIERVQTDFQRFRRIVEEPHSRRAAKEEAEFPLFVGYRQDAGSHS